jgi:hypothetical protein
MPYNNLPGIFERKLDGNLSIIPTNDNPIVLVLGTAAQGPSETVVRVDRVSDAAKTFGKEGTLTRGLYEASISGALNMRLFRVGATAARLEDIGASPGLTVETISKDDSAGTDYKLFFDASAGRLRVYRASDDELVYDNNPSYPLDKVDLGEVVVSGTVSGASIDIGSLATPITLAAADGVGDGPAVFTAGTDGLNLSRMQLWEALYNAYKLLENQEADVIIPMNVYLDDLNVLDLSDDQRTARALASLAAYPSAAADDDVLGKVFVQEYLGVNYFWWWFPSDIDAADQEAIFTSDAGANIFPSVGSADATTAADGTTLTAADFHEVNFAWDLANFCYVQSRDNTEMTGVIGMLPPTSFALKDISIWVGSLPTTTEDANGNIVISVNGTGLLGNKFMSGRLASGSLGIPAYTVDGIAGLFNGGFIAVDDDLFLDGTQIKDDNDHLVDIGKYISVVASYPILSNPSRTAAYTATGAPTYGGFYSVLSPVSAPTNKLLRSVRLPFRVNHAKLDLLAGQRYVTFHETTRGIVISDAPTAARPDSDYQRLSTVRQVKAAVDALRLAAEPFLGEGLTGATLAALDTAIDSQLKGLVKAGLIVRYEHLVTSTAQQRVLGQATVELKLVPAFELRQITVVIALAAV